MALKSKKDENPFEPPIDEDFLKTAREYRDNFEDDEDFQEALAIWPRCPRCGRRRVTRCPVCKTSGTLFPLGDRDFWDFRSDEERERDAELFEAASRRRRVCGSNGRSCDCDDENGGSAPPLEYADAEIVPGVRDLRRPSNRDVKTSDVFDDLPDKRRRRRAWAKIGRAAKDAERSGIETDFSTDYAADNDAETAAQETPELVLCFVCDEAFEPKFPRRCEWCDYDFGDGNDADSFEDSETSADVAEFVARKEAEKDVEFRDEPNSPRVFWTLALMAGGAAALLGYFAFALR